MDDERDVLVCNRVEAFDIPMIPGTTKLRCTDCDHEVWCAPTGQKMVIELGLATLCTVCAYALMAEEEEGEVKIMAPTAEQVEELMDTLAAIEQADLN